MPQKEKKRAKIRELNLMCSNHLCSKEIMAKIKDILPYLWCSLSLFEPWDCSCSCCIQETIFLCIENCTVLPVKTDPGKRQTKTWTKLGCFAFFLSSCLLKPYWFRSVQKPCVHLTSIYFRHSNLLWHQHLSKTEALTLKTLACRAVNSSFW